MDCRREVDSQSKYTYNVELCAYPFRYVSGAQWQNQQLGKNCGRTHQIRFLDRKIFVMAGDAGDTKISACNRFDHHQRKPRLGLAVERKASAIFKASSMIISVAN